MSSTKINYFKPVVWIPLNERGDYDCVQYSSEFSWEANDKILVESVVSEFYNSFYARGEKSIDTSFGELLITHEIHPNVARRKLIRGFIVDASRN